MAGASDSKKTSKPKAKAKAPSSSSSWSTAVWLAVVVAAFAAGLIAGGGGGESGDYYATAVSRLQALSSRALQALSGASEASGSAAGVDCSDAQQYLTDLMPVKGFHVLCVASTPADTCVTCYLRLLGYNY